jgi:hypothetical protein
MGVEKNQKKNKFSSQNKKHSHLDLQISKPSILFFN